MYQIHAQQVARWAERLAGPGFDIEDIVHEVFAIAFARVHTFRGESSLATWLFGITDKVIRHRRRKERWRCWLSGSANETAGHLASDGPDPLRLVESNQVAAVVSLFPPSASKLLLKLLSRRNPREPPIGAAEPWPRPKASATR